MRLFLDCEFNGYRGELISMALVPETDGFGHFYRELEIIEYPVEWVRDNVIPLLSERPTTEPIFKQELEDFLSQFSIVEIIADWPDDIKYFCEQIITGPGTCIKTPVIVSMHVMRDLDTEQSEVPHHALEDAKALREMYFAHYEF